MRRLKHMHTTILALGDVIQQLEREVRLLMEAEQQKQQPRPPRPTKVSKDLMLINRHYTGAKMKKSSV